MPKKQRKKEKVENTEDLSLGNYVELSTGSTDTSHAFGRSQRRVHFNIPYNLATPVVRVTRRKIGVATAEVELPCSPPETRKTLRSKRNAVKTEFEKAKEDTSDLLVSSSVRKKRGKKLTSAVEISASPARRKQQTEVAADTESSSPLKRGQCNTATVEVQSPLPSSRRQRNADTRTGKELVAAKGKRHGTVNTGFKLSSPPNVLQTTTVTVDTVLSPPRRRRRDPVAADVEIPQVPVTRKTRGKTLTTAVSSSSSTVNVLPVENHSSKLPAGNSSPLPATRRGKQERKAVDPPSPVFETKLQSTELLGESYVYEY